MSVTAAVAFDGFRRIAAGPLAEVALAVRDVLDRGDHGPVLVLDAHTSAIVDLDTRGTDDDIRLRYAVPDDEPAPADSAPRGPGRPRLGVVPREITLLPRHWDWLATQPGGASVTLRRLVEQARLGTVEQDLARQAQEITYRFMAHLAGNEGGFEEATRALFAGDRGRFLTYTASWPHDVREHALDLAADAFGDEMDPSV